MDSMAKNNLLLIGKLAALLTLPTLSAQALELKASNDGVKFYLDGELIMESPQEGLWAIAKDWKDNRPEGFSYANPSGIDTRKDCAVLEGEIKTDGGVWTLKDVYTPKGGGLIECRRRYSYRGPDEEKITLKNGFSIPAETDKILIPSVIYYKNPSGYKHGKERVPTFSKQDSPDVLFEEHRLPMPFVSVEFERNGKLFSAALHTLPSKAAYGNIEDQWWSLGAEIGDGKTALVSTSGAVAYNGEWGRVKSLQRASHKYPDTYLNVKDGAIIEKVLYISAKKCPREGSGFMQAVDASLNIFEPYSSAGMPAYGDIVRAKYKFSKTRYHETEDYAGFFKYPEANARKHIVFGWCGQAAAMGYAYQHLQSFDDDGSMRERAQKSLDFLSGAEFYENGFRTAFDTVSKKWIRGEILSQAQGLQNMLMAIKSSKFPQTEKMNLDPSKWEAFARRASDFHAERVLKDDWNPLSTSEAFLGAPLALGFKLFGDEKYKRASLKIADTYAKRHIDMREVYWGGTLDAVGEDKEGAWAAFQAFLAAYDITGEAAYLDYAKHAAYVMLTYTVVWKIEMPAGRLSDRGFNSVGWTAVSPQNEHLDVYGALYTPALYRLGAILKDERLQKLSELMFRTCGQLIDENGSQGEQIQQTNFAQHRVSLKDSVYSFRGGYVEKWTVFWITAHFLNAAAQFAEMDADFAK